MPVQRNQLVDIIFAKGLNEAQDAINDLLSDRDSGSEDHGATLNVEQAVRRLDLPESCYVEIVAESIPYLEEQMAKLFPSRKKEAEKKAGKGAKEGG